MINDDVLQAKINMNDNEIRFLNEALAVGDLLEIPFGPMKPECPPYFSFNAPTCRRNTFLVARALTIGKPLLLEGSPGAGKSSLVTAIAKSIGQPLVRLNLSEQTVCVNSVVMRDF